MELRHRHQPHRRVLGRLGVGLGGDHAPAVGDEPALGALLAVDQRGHRADVGGVEAALDAAEPAADARRPQLGQGVAADAVAPHLAQRVAHRLQQTGNPGVQGGLGVGVRPARHLDGRTAPRPDGVAQLVEPLRHRVVVVAVPVGHPHHADATPFQVEDGQRRALRDDAVDVAPAAVLLAAGLVEHHAQVRVVGPVADEQGGPGPQHQLHQLVDRRPVVAEPFPVAGGQDHFGGLGEVPEQLHHGQPVGQPHFRLRAAHDGREPGLRVPQRAFHEVVVRRGHDHGGLCRAGGGRGGRVCVRGPGGGPGPRTVDHQAGAEIFWSAIGWGCRGSVVGLGIRWATACSVSARISARMSRCCWDGGGPTRFEWSNAVRSARWARFWMRRIRSHSWSVRVERRCSVTPEADTSRRVNVNHLAVRTSLGQLSYPWAGGRNAPIVVLKLPPPGEGPRPARKEVQDRAVRAVVEVGRDVVMHRSASPMPVKSRMRGRRDAVSSSPLAWGSLGGVTADGCAHHIRPVGHGVGTHSAAPRAVLPCLG